MTLLHKKEGRLVDRTHAVRYVGHSDSDSICIMLDETSDCLFRRSRAPMLEGLESAASDIPAEPHMDLNDDFY